MYIPPLPTVNRSTAVFAAGVGATLEDTTRSVHHLIVAVTGARSGRNFVRSSLTKRAPFWSRNASPCQSLSGGMAANPYWEVSEPDLTVKALAASRSLSQVQSFDG